MKTYLPLATLLLAATTSPTLAADREVHGTVTAGVGVVPEYEGADKLRIIPLAGGKVAWGQRYVALEGLTLRANILESEVFEFGPIASLTLKRKANIKSVRVASLGTIDDAYEVGAFAAASLPVTGNDRIRLSIQGVHDVSRVHKGWLATGTLSYIAPASSRLTITADVTTTYASADYARRYFDVSAAGAAVSGLAAYQTKAGFKDVGAGLSAGYAIDRRWSIVGGVNYKRLVGSIADSPIVSREGNRDQLSGAIGVAISF